MSKYLKHFSNNAERSEYLVGSIEQSSDFTRTFPKDVVLFSKEENEVQFDKFDDVPVIDILYANANGNKKVDQTILDPSLGYVPIGLCIAKAGFFGENEPARWMSLKYMNYTTPETGSLESQTIKLGQNGKQITSKLISTGHKNTSGYSTVFKSDWSWGSNDIVSLFNENNNWNISELGEVNTYFTTDIDGKNKTQLWLNAATEQSTWQTDESIINSGDQGYSTAACCCARYHTLGTQPGDWYLGGSGEICILVILKPFIQARLKQISKEYPNYCAPLLRDNTDGISFWSSTEMSNSICCRPNFYKGMLSFQNKNSQFNVIGLLQY